MRAADLREGPARRLRTLARAAARSTEAEFLPAEDHVLYGGFAWEWLRNRPPGAFSVGTEATHLGAGARDLHAYGDALEPLWGGEASMAERADALLWACATLRAALPEDFWLPIEADIPLVVLSPTYREMRVCAYNRAAAILADRTEKPRWQPYLGSVAPAPEQSLRAAPRAMAASWAIHEVSHVVLMTAPPVDHEAPIPRTFVRWLLGQEGKTIAVSTRVGEEVRLRMPHPFFTGLFNTASFRYGHEPVRRVRGVSRALLGAWDDLCRYAFPPRVPGRRALKALQTNEDFAVGSLVYALEHRALFTSGARAAVVRQLLPKARPGRDRARALEQEVASVVAGRSRLDPRARARARGVNEAAVRAFRAAELHDYLSVLPGSSREDASLLSALGDGLAGQRPSASGLVRADAALRAVVARRLAILAPFGFGARYADDHPSLFDVRA